MAKSQSANDDQPATKDGAEQPVLPAKKPAAAKKKAAPAKKVAPAKKPAPAKKQPAAKRPYSAALARDPNMAGFEPDFGNFANVGSPEFRAQITTILTSSEAVNRIIGAVSAAPSRPPVTAIEQLLLDHGGDTAFGKEPKKMVGRLIRQIVEHLGGHFVRRGVPVTVISEFKKGSIYKL
jgi:hypothetical protein